MKRSMGTTAVHVFTDVDSLIEAFSTYFKSLVNLKDSVFNLALSGGNTPIKWFDYLAMHERNWEEWKKVMFYWGDERCVPPDDPESNYGMAHNHLFSKIALISDKQIRRIPGEIDPDSAASAYEKVLWSSLPISSEIPQFDLVVLGLGEDGHTASIFPKQIDLWHEPKLCVVATHPKSGQKRVSLTGRIINHARHIAVLAVGRNKSNRVAEILNLRKGHGQLPGSLVRATNGQLHWYLDGEAGKHLKS